MLILIWIVFGSGVPLSAPVNVLLVWDQIRSTRSRSGNCSMWSVCRPCLTSQVHPNFIQSWLPQNALFSIFYTIFIICAGSSISMEYSLLLCPDQLLLLLFIVIVVPWSIFPSPSQGSAATCFWDILERRFHTKYPLCPPEKNSSFPLRTFFFLQYFWFYLSCFLPLFVSLHA